MYHALPVTNRTDYVCIDLFDCITAHDRYNNRNGSNLPEQIPSEENRLILPAPVRKNDTGTEIPRTC